jgi:hypothetical protein
VSKNATPTTEASTAARIGGVLLSIITGALAVVLIATLFTADVDAVDAVMRVASAAVLGTIAVVVGLAAVTPGVLRRLIERLSGSR